MQRHQEDQGSRQRRVLTRLDDTLGLSLVSRITRQMP